MSPHVRRLVLGFLLLGLVPGRTQAAITITGFAYGSEDAQIGGMAVENFEDVTLLPGLTIRFGGSAATTRTYTGTMPRTWNPATASSCCTLGGPFPANAWDGQNALCNGGHGTGSTGLSAGTGNFWDFQFSDSVTFLFDTPHNKVGVGLSNFQSLGGPTAVTNHELIVNGVSRGLVETLLPGYAPGVNVRFRYMIITATAPDVIQSFAIQNVSALDGLVFDKLALDVASPALPTSWGRLKTLYR